VELLLKYINVFAETKAENIIAPGSAPVIEMPEILPVNMIIPVIFIFLFSLLAISAIVSFIVSGYSHVLNISLQDKEKANGEFISGVVKHYFKYTVYIFLHLLTFSLMIIVLVLASMPAMLSLKMVFQGHNDLVLASIFITLISVLVLFFGTVMYLMYSAYMYPSLTNFKKGAFFMARKVVNSYFWYLMPRFLGFVIVLTGWSLLLFTIDFGVANIAALVTSFILNVFVKLTVLFMFVFFLYHSFRVIKTELQNAQE
jgi:hypothetical protein